MGFLSRFCLTGGILLGGFHSNVFSLFWWVSLGRFGHKGSLLETNDYFAFRTSLLPLSGITPFLFGGVAQPTCGVDWLVLIANNGFSYAGVIAHPLCRQRIYRG